MKQVSLTRDNTWVFKVRYEKRPPGTCGDIYLNVHEGGRNRVLEPAKRILLLRQVLLVPTATDRADKEVIDARQREKDAREEADLIVVQELERRRPRRLAAVAVRKARKRGRGARRYGELNDGRAKVQRGEVEVPLAQRFELRETRRERKQQKRSKNTQR